MKKIILAVAVLALVAAAGVAGTRALFSDTETSEANSFTAGSIDLTLTSTVNSDNNATGNGVQELNNNEALFAFADLKPGDEGSATINAEVTSNQAYLCASAELTDNLENTFIDPEQNTGDAGAPEGELDKYLQVRVVDGGGNELVAPMTLENFNATGYEDLGTIDPGAANSQDYTLEYCFGEFDGSGSCSADILPLDKYNDAQTDSLAGSLAFTAIQTRNNEGFQCSDLNPASALVADGQVNAENYELVTTMSQDRTGADSPSDVELYARVTDDTVYLAAKYLGTDPTVDGSSVFNNFYIDGNNNDILDEEDRVFLVDIDANDVVVQNDDASDDFSWGAVEADESGVTFATSGDNKVVEIAIGRAYVGNDDESSIGVAFQPFGYETYPEDAEWGSGDPAGSERDHPENYHDISTN